MCHSTIEEDTRAHTITRMANCQPRQHSLCKVTKYAIKICFVCICIIILSFSVRPRFEEINVPISGIAGGMVLLSCRSSGFPTPSIVWRRNGALLLQNSKFNIFISSVVLPEQERISTRVSRLEISNLVLGDELEYSCFAENDLARPQQQESSRELIKILCEFAY